MGTLPRPIGAAFTSISLLRFRCHAWGTPIVTGACAGLPPEGDPSAVDHAEELSVQIRTSEPVAGIPVHVDVHLTNSGDKEIVLDCLPTVQNGSLGVAVETPDGGRLKPVFGLGWGTMDLCSPVKLAPGQQVTTSFNLLTDWYGDSRDGSVLFPRSGEYLLEVSFSGQRSNILGRTVLRVPQPKSTAGNELLKMITEKPEYGLFLERGFISPRDSRVENDLRERLAALMMMARQEGDTMLSDFVGSRLQKNTRKSK
jgi:hypothetical protein